MATRLLVFVGAVFGGFVFVVNALLMIESLSRGQSMVGATVAAVLGALICAGSIWALSLEKSDDQRDPFGRARFEDDRKAAEKGGLE